MREASSSWQLAGLTDANAGGFLIVQEREQKSLHYQFDEAVYDHAAVGEQMRTSLNRLCRTVILAGSTLSLLLMSGCSSSGNGKKMELRFWCGFTGADGRQILKIIKQFNAEHPDIHVTLQRIEWPQYYNKLFVAGLADRAPEVFVIHSSSVERFWQANLLRPLDDLASGTEPLNSSDFSPNIWEAVVREGRPFAIPLDIHMIGMYYNKKLFRQAGIVDEHGEARPPRTREEFLDAARRLTRDIDGDGNIDQYGYVFTWFRTNAITAIEQWGGHYFNASMTRAEMHNPANVEAMRFLSDLIYREKVAPVPYSDAFLAFLQGRAGMAFEGVYLLNDLRRQKDLEYGCAPMPVLGNQPAAWADSHVMCINPELDKRRTTAAWTLIRYLSDNSLEWAESGQVPVRKSLLQSERFQKMKDQLAFAEQIPYVAYVPRIAFVFEFLSALDTAAEQVLRDTSTPEVALQWASEEVNRVLERRRRRNIELSESP